MSEPQREALPAPVEPTPKPAYELPRATFVPLQMEERLMACDKAGSCIGSPNTFIS